jgi:pimeloyl-ACP methyl ester carboxylesterase
VAIEFISIARVWAAPLWSSWAQGSLSSGDSFNPKSQDLLKFVRMTILESFGGDSGPKDSCSLRVGEIHNALKNAGIKGPYVFVGASLGGLVARLYAGRNPEEVAGMVFVDHAFMLLRWSPPSTDATVPLPPSNSQTHDGVGIESDPNSSKLSSRDRELHLWALSQPRYLVAVHTNGEILPQCLAEADAIAGEHPYPLGDKPLVNVSTDEWRSADYVKLQADLLSLSQNSKEIVARNSSHAVIFDRPDVVVNAISQAVQSVRNNAKL